MAKKKKATKKTAKKTTKKATKKATKKVAKKATKKAATKKAAAKKVATKKATTKTATTKKVAKTEKPAPKKNSKPTVPSLEEIARDKNPKSHGVNPFAPSATTGGDTDMMDEEVENQQSFDAIDDEFEPVNEYTDPDLDSFEEEEEEEEADDEGYF